MTILVKSPAVRSWFWAIWRRERRGGRSLGGFGMTIVGAQKGFMGVVGDLEEGEAGGTDFGVFCHDHGGVEEGIDGSGEGLEEGADGVWVLLVKCCAEGHFGVKERLEKFLAFLGIEAAGLADLYTFL